MRSTATSCRSRASDTTSSPPVQPRARWRAAQVSPDLGALLVVIAAVVVANLPFLLGQFDPNPLGPRSNLMSASSSGVLAGVSTIDPNNGAVSEAIGHRAALDWLDGQTPWWDPFEGVGAPLAGETQSAALFPPTLLLVMSNGQLYEHIMLEILAGVGTFLLLRQLGAGRWPSVAAGTAFALNGTFAWFAHAPANPVAFLPFLLLGIEFAWSASQRSRRGGWWLIAIALALSLYAGFPEGSYIDGLLAAAWGIWRLLACDADRRRAFLTKLLSGVSAGMLLAAPALVTFLDYLASGNSGDHARGLSNVHLPAVGLAQLLIPYVYGPIFALNDPHSTLATLWGHVGGYFTASLVLFAVLGLFSRGNRGLRIMLAVWLVLAISHMFGGPPGIDRLLALLPGMDSVAFYRYADPAVELAVVVLAVLGLEELVASGARTRIAAGGILTLILLAVAAFGAHLLTTQLSGETGAETWFRAAILWAGAVVLVAIGAALLHDERRRTMAVCAVVAIDAIVMFAVPELSAPQSESLDTAPTAYLQRHLGLGRFFTLGPIQPDYGAYFGIASINDNDIPVPTGWTRYVTHDLDPYVYPLVFTGDAAARSRTAPSTEAELLTHLDGYRAAGVSYVVAPAGQSLPQSPAALTLVFRSATSSIYRLAGAAPYFSTANARCAVQPAGRDSVTVSCSGPATLIRREQAMPGWSARINGTSSPVRTYRGLFQAVHVPAGRSHVTFTFVPPGIGWSLVAMALGTAWLLGSAALPGRLSGRSSRQAVAQPPR